MAAITYTTKNKAGAAPANQWRDTDANEVKTSVNALYQILQYGVFAHLTEAAGTVVATPETYIPIEGIFENVPSTGFEFVETPGIEYTGSQTLYFEIDAHATVKSNQANTTIRGAIRKNGVLVTASVMSLFAKTAGESSNFSGTSVIQLEEGDEVQLVVTADKAATITFDNITATIRPFVVG
jgi:hypothetical protein